MRTFVDVLAEMINDLENDVIHSMQSHNRVATGKTIGEFQTIVTGNHAELITPLSVDALEYGRSPTSPGAAAGDPTVYEAIVEWATARNISEFGTNDKGETVNVWRAITESIHKKGFKGTPGVLTEPLSDENINKRLAAGSEEIATMFGQDVSDLFDVFDEI